MNNPQRIAELIQQGKKLEAIKLLRETTGISLQEAKEQVEQLMAEIDTGTVPDAGATDHATVPPDVLELARAGRKIEAIKRLREQTGIGLKEAKERVDAALGDQGSGGGCAPVLLVGLAVLSLGWILMG